MLRNSFNSGEVSPSMRLRIDLDNYKNACAEITNFDIIETGGITKRKGFNKYQYLEKELGTYSSFFTTPSGALFSYNATDNETYIVAVYKNTHTGDGTTLYFHVFSIEGDNKGQNIAWKIYSRPEVQDIKTCCEFKTIQINAILLFMHPLLPVLELGQKNGKWYIEEFKYKEPPWNAYEPQDIQAIVKKDATSAIPAYGDTYSVSPSSIPENMTGTRLRVSYNKNEKVIEYNYKDISESKPGYVRYVMLYKDDNKNPHMAVGDIVAYVDRKHNKYEKTTYWTCKNEEGFSKRYYVDGIDYPKPYTAIFDRALLTQVGGVPYNRTSFREYFYGTGTLKKNETIEFNEIWADVYTCIKQLPSGSEITVGKSPDELPEYFRKGCEVGHTTCKGKWEFSSEGTWVGGFEIQVSYDTKEPDFNKKEWIKKGSVTSTLEEPINQTIAGDESQEECYIRLALMKVELGSFRSRDPSSENNRLIAQGVLPACNSMRLKVYSFEHDTILHRRGDTAFTLEEGSFEDDDDLTEGIKSYKWSYEAFSKENGYPACGCLLDQRLVFAGTKANPMSVWMSQVNDISNFDLIDADNSALALTISSDSQEPIRWVASQRGRLLVGTSQGEFVVSSNDGGVITPSNATCIQHGFNGSETVGNALLDDSVIYLARGGRRAKKYGYSEQIDGYISTDLNIFAEHMLAGKGGVKQITVQKTPYPRVYFLMNDGTISVLAYNEKHNVLGWSRYVSPCGKFVSICNLSLPNQDDIGFALIEQQGTQAMDLTATGITDNYTDEGEIYEAKLTTNILQSTEIGGSKRNVGEIMLYIADDTPTKGISVTVNNWQKENLIPDQDQGVMKAGWNSQLGFSTIEWDSIVGFKSRSPYPLTVLALQVR